MRISILLAICLFGIALAVDPKDDPLRVGDHFFKRGEFGDALASYRKVYDAHKNDPQALWRMGAVYNRLGMNLLVSKERNDTLKIANDYLKQALATDRNIAQVHTELAWNLVYISLLHENWCDFALGRRIREELDYAARLDSTMAELYFLRGLWHMHVSKVSILKRKPENLGDADILKALDGFKKAVSLDSENALYRFELGNFYLTTGDTNAAIRTFELVKTAKSIPFNRKYIDLATTILSEIKK